MQSIEIINSPYAEFLDTKSEEELEELGKIKRFLECYQGDEELRNIIKSGKVSLQQLARNRGIELDDINSLRPLVDPKFTHFRKDATIETWPLTAKWDEFYQNTLETLKYYLWMGDSDGEFKEFDDWRKKQMLRTLMDVGGPANYLIHPPIAFELSDGCSVGCWFCGISAKKFGGHYELDQNGENEWRDILTSVKNVLGRGMSTGFCYWATEPLDHPDYDKFISTYFDVTGVIPQTTSAIPLKDIELTKKVLDMWSQSRFVPNRFSVLSTSIMKKIHAEFSPRELLGVEMVMQGKGSMSAKSVAGKAYNSGASENERRMSTESMQDGTIACVTGFLVNLPNRTVRLVSPTIPTEEWPDGYYVYASDTFESAEDLEQVMRKMVLEETARETDSNLPISLHPNYWVEKVGSQNSIRDHRFGMSMGIFNSLAPLLQDGSKTPSDIVKQAVSDGHDPILAIKVIQDLISYGMAGNSLRPAV